MVWYSHLFQNFPQFVVIHTVKGFGVANKAKVEIFLELSCFVDGPTVPLPFLNPTGTSGSSRFMYCCCVQKYMVEILPPGRGAARRVKGIPFDQSQDLYSKHTSLFFVN